MTKLRTALAACTALMAVQAPAQAQDYGQYAFETMRELALTYPGRFTGAPGTGTTFFAAADYMAGRLGTGAVRQEFTSTRGPSQNVIVTMPGETDRFIVVGAHFDTAGTSPDLQGVDDNASGAGLLTELAAHMSGMETQTGLVFNAFGAEEIGLQGARHYVDTLNATQRANLAGMINIDSLITGDFMYGHAGSNYLANPDNLAFWSRAHAIADELGIDLRSNPGLNPDYPILTGCCSDAAAFEGFDIPILWLEATNWQIGDLDGYDQTTNPAIPGGRTWHNPVTDNWDFLREALGEDRFEQRMRDYARLMTRFLTEETGADLVAAAQDAGQTAAQIADLAGRQHDQLSALSMNAAGSRLDAPGAIGQFVPTVTIEGSLTPSGSSAFGSDGSGALAARVGGGWQLDETLGFGGHLAYARSGDDLDQGDIEAKGYQIALDAAYRQGADWAVGAVSWGKSDLSGTRDFTLRSGLGETIVQRDFDWQTNAYTLGARVQAGRDFQTATGVTFGPTLGLDYRRTRIGAFGEGSDRRAIAYDSQSVESFEISLGARAATDVQLAGRPVTLAATGALIHDLAEGAPAQIRVTDSQGTARTLGLAGRDRNFARVGLSARTAISALADGWVSVESRLGHDAGSQATVGAGLGLRF